MGERGFERGPAVDPAGQACQVGTLYGCWADAQVAYPRAAQASVASMASVQAVSSSPSANTHKPHFKCKTMTKHSVVLIVKFTAESCASLTCRCLALKPSKIPTRKRTAQFAGRAALCIEELSIDLPQ